LKSFFALLLLSIFFTSSSVADYNRDDFQFNSYKPKGSIGFYTLMPCALEIDHVVSLKDAWLSGAKSWAKHQLRSFANDTFNHVSACDFVNRSKGSSTPTDFLRKSQDGIGVDYVIKNWCSYLQLYNQVKTKYHLSNKTDYHNLSLCYLDK